MTFGNLGYVLRPLFPILARATFDNDFRKDGVLPILKREIQVGLNRLVVGSAVLALTITADTDDLNLAGALVVQLKLVDDGIEAVIVCPKRLQDLPDDFVFFIVC